jgi:hypothetical protein
MHKLAKNMALLFTVARVLPLLLISHGDGELRNCRLEQLW